MRQKPVDYLIVGAGIIGMTLALALKKRHPHSHITLLEKEADVGEHASGRNSGVLHAGFYYSEGSLKARFSVTGNRLMKAFCKEQGIPVDPCQKVVVAQTRDDVPTLEMLYQRGLNNGVSLEMISAKQLAEIEPAAKTVEKALLSPSTASVDPRQVCQTLKQCLLEAGVSIVLDTEVRQIYSNYVSSNRGPYYFKHLINCAGLYAVKLAQRCGLAKQYAMLPFKGLYKVYSGTSPTLRCHIYPTPALDNPFLGVHFTKTCDGKLKIGPTAMPALWYQQYQGWQHFSLKECLNILYQLGHMFVHNSNGIRRLAGRELRKYRHQVMVADAQRLAHGFTAPFKHCSAGIRAQLYDRQQKQLVSDFVIESKDNTTHVLNVVSPAFTCAFAIADYLISDYLNDSLTHLGPLPA